MDNILNTGLGRELLTNLKRIGDGLKDFNKKLDEPEPPSREQMEFDIFRDLLKSSGLSEKNVCGWEPDEEAAVEDTVKCAKTARRIVSIFIEAGRKP
jgi:hypothetical protein